MSFDYSPLCCIIYAREYTHRTPAGLWASTTGEPRGAPPTRDGHAVACGAASAPQRPPNKTVLWRPGELREWIQPSLLLGVICVFGRPRPVKRAGCPSSILAGL